MQTIPVYYSPEMSVDSHGYSPSASKPEKVVADWNNAGLAIDIRSFEPATAEHLSDVHDGDHVLDVLECRESNGHGNQILEVSQSCLWTVGSFVAATQEAIKNGQVACSPTSGFHHAGYDHCGGFCTFNGLMVAAHKMITNDVAVSSTLLPIIFRSENCEVDCRLGHGLDLSISFRDRNRQWSSSPCAPVLVILAQEDCSSC